MASGNSNFDKIITMTLQNHGKEIFDAVSQNLPLFYALKKRENIKIVKGGRSFTHPIYYAVNSSFKTYGKLDAIDTPIPDNYTRAEYPIKIAAGSLVISTFDLACNAGDKEKLLDYGEIVKKDAEISMAELMGQQVFKDGSATNDFDGVQHLISETPASQTDVAGIDASASGNTYWRNYSYDTAVTAFNTSQAGLTAMNTCLNQATFGRQGPRMVVTTKAIYQLYELGLTSNIRYVSTELADSGFQHLAYSTMPVVPDDNCPAGNMYFVDLDNLWLQLLELGNFNITPFQPSTNQLLKIALMSVFGNLTTGSRRTNAVVDSITG